MRGNKQQKNIKQQLCLLLAVILVCGAVPLESVLAVESETMLETETQTEEMQTGETLQEPETEPVETDSGKKDTETAGSAETEPESNTDVEKYTNISGFLWVDANEDGTYDSGEQPLADYPVYLYVEGDTDNAVQTATTDTDGTYRFENISPGSYVVGIKAEEHGTEYLLPLVGVQQDNKFYFAPDWSKVISNPIDIAADTVVEDIDAAMRTMPQIQPMANTTYTIDVTTQATVTSSITAQSIPGVSITSNVLTFDTTVDPTDTYILTGNTTTVSVVVASGVTMNITLDGVSISNAVSPLRLLGTANVNLTLSGTNTLTCTGTLNTGAYQAGIHINTNATLKIYEELSGILNATGGGLSAGIGGSSTTNGTVIINSGTITAIGGSHSAGIGGGSGNSINHGSGGTITINSGTVTATGGGNGGAGIGGGQGGAGGTITINDGMVTATGGNYGGAGIGGGGQAGSEGNGGQGGNITITGGTVIATGGNKGLASSNYYPAGIGGGGPWSGPTSGTNATTGTLVFTGGSIYPTNYLGAVSVATSTRNGSANGNVLLYMTTVTVRDASNNLVSNALVSVERPTYTYEAYTNASGIAYIWVPVGSTLFEAQHEDYGYGAETKTVTAVNTNTVTIILGMRTTLSQTPNTIAFISATNPTPVTLGVKAENKDTGALKDIISAQWFRVETTDTTYTASKTSFDSGFAAASSSNKGDDTTNLVETTGGTSSEKNYTMPVSENGKYWVLVHYKDGLGVDRYQVKSIVIDNIYTPSTGKYKGINSGDSSTLYDEATPSLTNASGDPIVGVAFELNSTATILTSTSDGTTAVAGAGATLTINAKNLAPLWITSAPTSQTVSVTGTNLGTTTFNYTLNPLAITVQFNSQGGTPSTIANQYYMSTDTFGTLPTVARTGYNLDGWFTAATGGTQVNATDTTGSHFASGSIVTLYAQWTVSAKNLTISNEVTGAYANMDKAFTYTIYFQDSGGTALASGTQFTYTGGVIAGSGATAPSGATLTLGSGGEATVTLTTGQTITIAGIATSAKVRVVQSTDANYTTSFKDSLDASFTSGADTGVRNMTAADRTFDFTNTRSVVPGGISTGSGGIVLLSLMALLALAADLTITAVHRRRAGAR